MENHPGVRPLPQGDRKIFSDRRGPTVILSRTLPAGNDETEGYIPCLPTEPELTRIFSGVQSLAQLSLPDSR